MAHFRFDFFSMNKGKKYMLPTGNFHIGFPKKSQSPKGEGVERERGIKRTYFFKKALEVIKNIF